MLMFTDVHSFEGYLMPTLTLSVLGMTPNSLSDGEASVLKLWGMWSTHSLPLLLLPLLSGIVMLLGSHLWVK